MGRGGSAWVIMREWTCFYESISECFGNYVEAKRERLAEVLTRNKINF